MRMKGVIEAGRWFLMVHVTAFCVVVLLTAGLHVMDGVSVDLKAVAGWFHRETPIERCEREVQAVVAHKHAQGILYNGWSVERDLLLDHCLNATLGR
jgi:hypothetical protein